MVLLLELSFLAPIGVSLLLFDRLNQSRSSRSSVLVSVCMVLFCFASFSSWASIFDTWIPSALQTAIFLVHPIFLVQLSTLYCARRTDGGPDEKIVE